MADKQMMFDAEAIARIKGCDEVYLVCKNDERLEDGHKDKSIHRCMWLKDFVSGKPAPAPVVQKRKGGRPKGSKNKKAAKPAANPLADGLSSMAAGEPMNNPAEEDNDRQALRRNEEEGDGSAPDRERGWNGESGQQ